MSAAKSRILGGSKARIKLARKYGPEGLTMDEIWEKLSKNIVSVLNHDCANLSFVENHKYAYSMVLYGSGDKLYRGTAELIAVNLDKLAEEYIVPAFPKDVSGDPAQRIHEGEMLLKALKKVWDDHTSGLSILRDLLKYMDRVYTKSAGVPEIWEAGLVSFIKNIFKPPIEGHFISAILTIIQTERDGYITNRSSVKACMPIFLQLRKHVDRELDSVCKRNIEPAVLKEIEAFYKKDGERLLETCDASEFLRKVEGRFLEEESQTHHILLALTTVPLERILEQQLVSAHLSTVISHTISSECITIVHETDGLNPSIVGQSDPIRWAIIPQGGGPIG